MNRGRFPLHKAAAEGDLSTCELLVQRNPSVIIMERDDSRYKKAPLHYAAANGRLAVCQFLLAKGAYVDAPDQFLATPLHDAAYMRQYEVCKLLIKHGADVHAQNSSLQTPLHMAVLQDNNEPVVRLLIARTLRWPKDSLNGTAEQISSEEYLPVFKQIKERTHAFLVLKHKGVPDDIIREIVSWL